MPIEERRWSWVELEATIIEIMLRYEMNPLDVDVVRFCVGEEVEMIGEEQRSRISVWSSLSDAAGWSLKDLKRAR